LSTYSGYRRKHREYDLQSEAISSMGKIFIKILVNSVDGDASSEQFLLNKYCIEPPPPEEIAAIDP